MIGLRCVLEGPPIVRTGDELERLTKTLGLRVIGRVTQKRRGLGAASLLGEGKLEELAEYTGGRGFVPRYAVPGSRTALETESFEAELSRAMEVASKIAGANRSSLRLIDGDAFLGRYAWSDDDYDTSGPSQDMQEVRRVAPLISPGSSWRSVVARSSPPRCSIPIRSCAG